MFVKVTYAQTIELDEVFTTNDQEEEYLDDCDPDSNNYVECDCYPENCVDPQTEENCNKTCPDSQTLKNCTCVNKPNKNWYQDIDDDDYHSATKSYYKSPGTGWKPGVSKGPDCDDTKKCVTTDCTKVEWYLDNDGDGWYGQKKNDYAFCKPEGSWNITSNKGFDCNDYEFDILNLFCFPPDPCDFGASNITDAASAALAAVNEDFTFCQAACNIGVNHAFEDLTCNDDLNGLLANDIMNDLNGSNDWEEVEMSESQALANDGDLVVAGATNSSGSGHVVMIVPGTEVHSGSWGGNVPVAMDTGPNKKWLSKGINHSWSSSSKDRVQFFKYIGDISCDPNNNCE